MAAETGGAVVREVELKGVVDDLPARRARVEAAGGRLVLEGRLEDRRYDAPDRRLSLQDVVLRLRAFRGRDGTALASLDWKGPTLLEAGYKVRDELSAALADPAALAQVLALLGYQVTREVDRDIVQYELGGATIRFETYPRMDCLVEVEGAPDAIEAAIAALGLPRASFTTERLQAFALRYWQRTGVPPATSDAERRGERRWTPTEAG